MTSATLTQTTATSQGVTGSGGPPEATWIPGSVYRSDCAVGQLRPIGMKPCSDEQLTSKQTLCQQHRYPTSTECARRLEYFDRKAGDALAVTLDHAAGEWYRVESRNAAAFWRKEASRYRRFLF